MKVKLIVLLILLLCACSNQQNNSSQEAPAAKRGEGWPLMNSLQAKQEDKTAQEEDSNQANDSITEKYASFAFQSVKWNNTIYRLTEETISEAEVEEEIGEVVTQSSTETEETPDNSSNFLAEGTKLWAIKGIDTSEAIAYERENGVYRKLIADE
ncbi:hypothetical protein J40TS1_27580 [Paenibacillus montaniterrae]|uniref:Lipoprotein n=1 Tax=Paenibacillus montaniterrae TaxID=429341 RepID=A0A919YRN4_9BACL|nr:hypothetical protein [Paenibacillus montaniterrae]GIP17116.1 hypothetical protein J40TS1_27580 [Paenibacillus montaniterrae]